MTTPNPQQMPDQGLAASPSGYIFGQLSLDRGLAGGLILSLLIHATALLGLSLVHLGESLPSIPAVLVVLAAPGSSAPRGEAPARVALPRAAPPRPPAPVARGAPPAVGEAPAPREVAPAPTPQPEWPTVQAPLFRVPGLAAETGASDASTDAGPSTGTVAISGSLGTRKAPAPAAAGFASAGRASGRGSFVAPRAEAEITPVYPDMARRAGIEGTTLVRAHVMFDGTVGVAEVRRSAGHAELDRAALDAIRAARFVPAQRNGVAVSVWVEIPIQFTLRQ